MTAGGSALSIMIVAMGVAQTAPRLVAAPPSGGMPVPDISRSALDLQPGAARGTEPITDTIRYPSGAATIEAFLARPSPGADGRKFQALIVVHDDQGLNEAMRETTRLFARSGFIAMAPNFASQAAGAAAQAATAGGAGSRSAVASIPLTRSVYDLRAAFAYLEKDARVDRSKISVVGFGWGGWRAFKLAEETATLHRAVVFYGTTSNDEQLHRIRAPILGHYAEYDFQTTGNVLATKRRLGARFTYYIYPETDRGFFGGSSGPIDYVALVRDRRDEAAASSVGQSAGSAAQAAASQAWERTLVFLRAR